MAPTPRPQASNRERFYFNVIKLSQNVGLYGQLHENYEAEAAENSKTPEAYLFHLISEFEPDFSVDYDRLAEAMPREKRRNLHSRVSRLRAEIRTERDTLAKKAKENGGSGAAAPATAKRKRAEADAVNDGEPAADKESPPKKKGARARTGTGDAAAAALATAPPPDLNQSQAADNDVAMADAGEMPDINGLNIGPAEKKEDVNNNGAGADEETDSEGDEGGASVDEDSVDEDNVDKDKIAKETEEDEAAHSDASGSSVDSMFKWKPRPSRKKGPGNGLKPMGIKSDMSRIKGRPFSLQDCVLNQYSFVKGPTGELIYHGYWDDGKYAQDHLKLDDDTVEKNKFDYEHLKTINPATRPVDPNDPRKGPDEELARDLTNDPWKIRDLPKNLP